MAVRGKDEGVTLGQQALVVTQFKIDREVYEAVVRNDIGAPGAFNPYSIMPTFNLGVDGDVATLKAWDVREMPRVELMVDVEYAQNCVWIELWTYLYVVEGGQLLTLDSDRSRKLAVEIKGHAPLYGEEFLEILTSDEAIAHLEEVGPELIQQMGRSLAQWELSH